MKITGTWMEKKDLSDAWTGFTRFVLLNESPPEGYTWSRERLTRNKQPQDQTVYGQICGNICLMQRKRKQNKGGLSRNQKLDNARQLRGIFFIEPNDEGFKLTMKAARRKWEVPMPAAMPCKRPTKSSGEPHRNIGKRKTKYACVVDADERTRPRLEGAGHKPHQDHITAKGMDVLCANSCRCLKHKKFQMQRRQWKKNGNIWRESRHGS